MLTVGHTQIDAVLATYRTILAETIDSLAAAQGTVATLTADRDAAQAALRAALDRQAAQDAEMEAAIVKDAANG